MRNGYCQFWFEKQPEARSSRENTLVDVWAHGAIVVTETLVCARQRQPQFPLRPYSLSKGQPFCDGSHKAL
jgi:CDGSH-type Zn-finger protein